MDDNSSSGKRTSTRRAVVLVVDDEPYVTRGIQSALFRSPFEILAANSAADALVLMRERTIDVVVSDECMPGTTGIAFLTRVRSEFPATASQTETCCIWRGYPGGRIGGPYVLRPDTCPRA
jgi:response regulator RpfG family c-di-GMP phosphodiesterase